MNEEITKLMMDNGADLVGFADLGGIADEKTPFGIVVAAALPAGIVKAIHDGPNYEYYNEYKRINVLLDNLVTLGANFLKNRGYRAEALTVALVGASENKKAALPAKTVATRAGIGWIGKSDLLVTKQYGSALRISTLVTNAAFKCGKPVTASLCGDCSKCAEFCPGGALTGTEWSPEAHRDMLVDVHKCAETARSLCDERIGEELTICGKCIEICPHTQKYLLAAD